MPAVAGKISGTYVAVTAAGVVLVWSGWSNTSLAATFKGVLNGKLPAAGTGGITVPAAGDSTSANGSDTSVPSASSNANYLTVAQYLKSNGYSDAGAAGVVGCVAGESGGNPEAMQGGAGGGGGLIQWTPISAQPGLVTGNPTADLDAQLPAIIAYNNAQGSNLVSMLNQISDPVQAADFYSKYFERPKVTDSDVRASVAQSVYAQLQGGTA